MPTLAIVERHLVVITVVPEVELDLDPVMREPARDLVGDLGFDEEGASGLGLVARTPVLER